MDIKRVARLPAFRAGVSDPSSPLPTNPSGERFSKKPGPLQNSPLLGVRQWGDIMETSSYGSCFWLHVAMVTEHGLFMVNDLVIAFICALSYCVEVIYNLMEESPRRGPQFCLIVP